MSAVPVGGPLRLLREATVASLLAPVAPEFTRLEASGVTWQDGRLWIIFDNLPDIVGVDPGLVPDPARVTLVRQDGPSLGYEDIAHDDASGWRFLLIEAAHRPGGGWWPQIDEFDPCWQLIRRRWVELGLESRNKGLEGLTCVHRNGARFLLGLSEGDGVIHILVEGEKTWVVKTEMRLPHGLRFSDYSAISVGQNRIVVASQEDSAVWIGSLDPGAWRVADAGVVHPFPRDDRGRIVYGTVEGICWIDDHTLGVVSDRAKRSQPGRFGRTGESVHVFALP